jgi:hypothetical protein
LLAFVLALAVPNAAQAYLHVANATQAACPNSLVKVSFEQWSYNNVGPGPVYIWTAPSYNRLSDSDVVIYCAWKGNYGYPYPHSQGEARVRILGSDANPQVYFGGGYPQWVYLGTDPTNDTGWVYHGSA